MTNASILEHSPTAKNGKPHQGPIFPYRFSFEPYYLQREAPAGIQWGETFCRWSVAKQERPKALEWSHYGKGKGVTALPSDEPTRCCSESTPILFLTKRVDDMTGVIASGSVYIGTIAGHGWYSAPPGSEFLIRLVTDPDDVIQLRNEAAIYEEYESLWSNESFRENIKVPPLEFHGFFQSDTGNTGVIILKARQNAACNKRDVARLRKKTTKNTIRHLKMLTAGH